LGFIRATELFFSRRARSAGLEERKSAKNGHLG
jgi:hypothetical protein